MNFFGPTSNEPVRCESKKGRKWGLTVSLKLSLGDNHGTDYDFDSDEMLKKLDETARKEHRTRSELLRETARRYLSVESQLSKSGGSTWGSA